MAKKTKPEEPEETSWAPTRATACALQFKKMTIEKPPGTIARIEMLEVLSELSRLDVDELATQVNDLQQQLADHVLTHIENADNKEKSDGQENKA